MSRPKPFVVFVFTKEHTATSTRYGGFGRRLQKAGALPGHDILTVALENLIFIVRDDGTAEVIDSISSRNLGDADFVYLKSWEAMPEEAAALANYLFYRGVPFVDHLPLGMGVSKLVTAFRLWGNGLAVPPTLYVRRPDRLQAVLESPLAEELETTFILKDIAGSKGRLNFLTDRQAASAILQAHPHQQFICQRFIPNSGDYRIGVYDGVPSFAIQRVGQGETHLNNTSAGGTASHIALSDIPPPILQLARAAAEACELQLAGVDVMVDNLTQRPYILEVNQGSQIVTGAFPVENAAVFAESLNGMVRDRHAKPRHKPVRIIGRRTIASLPELEVKKITAKVDTGAYTSTLHAENIRIEAGQDKPELVFEIVPGPHMTTADGERRTIRTSEYSQQAVRSSNGQVADRYVIRTKLMMGGISFPISVTLENRSQMGFPLLLGRRVLRSRFLVNVELNEENKLEWKY